MNQRGYENVVAVRLLQLLADGRCWTAKQLAKAAETHLTTALNMLSAFRAVGVVEYEPWAYRAAKLDTLKLILAANGVRP